MKSNNLPEIKHLNTLKPETIEEEKEIQQLVDGVSEQPSIVQASNSQAESMLEKLDSIKPIRVPDKKASEEVELTGFNKLNASVPDT